MSSGTKLETYLFDYEGPDGEPSYYRVRATEISPEANLFNIIVTVRGVRSATARNVVEAEAFVTHHRHQITSGHAPGACTCLDS